MACIAKRRGRWVIDCYDQQGRRYRKTLNLGATKDDARKELRDIESKIDKGTFIPEKKTPLFSEVAEDWLKTKKHDVRQTTFECFTAIVKNKFGFFDNVKITQISIASVEQWIENMREQGVKFATVQYRIVILGQIMGYALRHRMIDFNPVKEAKKPRKKMGDTTKPQIWTPEQIKRFLEGIDSPLYHALFSTSVFSGARKGEVLGLKWQDVNYDKKQISINRTFNHQRLFSPKTQSSIRKIDVPPVLINELREWQLKSGGRGEDFVFSADNGKNPLREGAVDDYFRSILKAINLPKIRIHDLRHCYASLLLQQGESIKYIQTQLGHSTPNTTLNVYAHLMKDENPQAAERLERSIFGDGHKMVTTGGN